MKKFLFVLFFSWPIFSTAAQNTEFNKTYTPEEIVNDLVENNEVVVFSKSYCGYCRRAKELLDVEGIEYTTFELNKREDGGEIHQYLKERTGHRTVPNIWINKRFFGGSDTLSRAREDGSLFQLVKTRKSQNVQS